MTSTVSTHAVSARPASRMIAEPPQRAAAGPARSDAPPTAASDVFLRFGGSIGKGGSITVTNVLEGKDIALEASGDGQFDIVDRANGNARLGTLRRTAQSAVKTELYSGKGGFTAVLTSPGGLKYYALPGSTVSVDGTTVDLPGPRLAADAPTPAGQAVAAMQPQTLTPQAMILGAGLATRFEPVSGENTGYSKPAVPLLGSRSVIRLIADTLAGHGFSRLYVNTFFKPDSLKAGLSESSQAQSGGLVYIDEIGAPSGTAGALRKMLENPAKHGFDPGKPILIVQGDAVTDVDFSALMRAHERNNAYVTIGCQYLADKNEVSKFGIIETDQRDPDGVSGDIASFVEKPQPHETSSQLANTGFYIFSPESYPVILEVFQAMGPAGEKELDFAKHIFPRVLAKLAERNQGLPAAERKTFWAQKVDGYWSDIGNPTQYLKSAHDLYAGRTTHPLPADAAAYYDQGILYWPGAKAAAQQEGAQLAGNVLVAKPFATN